MMFPAGSKRGFTLIEIAVVILLISIMLLVTLPRMPDSPLTDQTRKTKRCHTKGDIFQLTQVITPESATGIAYQWTVAIGCR